MGSLTVPSSGLVYFDTNPVIYSVEKNPTYWPLLEPLWQAAKARGHRARRELRTLHHKRWRLPKHCEFAVCNPR
jgi:hypothetical protein